MGDDLGDLAARNAVLSCRLEMVCERRVGYALTYERCDGNQTAVAQPEPVGAAPYLPEEDVGANSPSCSRPAVCLIFCCAMIVVVFAVNANIARIILIFILCVFNGETCACSLF